MKRLFLCRDGAVARLSTSGGPLLPQAQVIPALWQLRAVGYSLVLLVEAEDSPAENARQKNFLELLSSQGIGFEAVLTCSHPRGSDCTCHKPHLGLLRPFLTRSDFEPSTSYVIGGADVDLALARNAGLAGRLVSDWPALVSELVTQPRVAEVERVTRETAISVKVTLDAEKSVTEISTGIGYFDHMLEQLAKHGGFSLTVRVKGDLEVDEHHTVEDTALAIGESLRRALGDKYGIGRYGFSLPMDEAESTVTVDLSGRAYSRFDGSFSCERVGELPTELVPHFYRSFADALGATLHIRVSGENAHHMVESTFKAVGRALRPALRRNAEQGLPSTKGVL